MIEPSVSTLLLSVSTAVLSVSSGFDLSNEKAKSYLCNMNVTLQTKYESKENVKIMNWRNGFLLSLVSYILYLIIWLILDDETANQLPGMATVDYVVDFLLCMLFTYISLGFSYLVFKILPFRTSYVWVIVYASCLLTLNNLVAFGMTSLFNLLWDETGNGLLDELINMKGAYTFAMIATFISSVYANTFFLQSYIRARDEKQALEMALMKEKEIALQSQLNSLKLQINPHFMFNNFNNLLELIEEDTKLAGKFLSNLSKCTGTSSPIWTGI